MDVHSGRIQACVRWPLQDRRITQEVRSFGTLTRASLALADWVAAAGVTPGTRESTYSWTEFSSFRVFLQGT